VEISVKKSVLESFKKEHPKEVEPFLGYRYSDQTNVRVDITKLSEVLLKKLQDKLSESKDQPSKLAASIIRLYTDTVANPNNQKPKTLQHLVQCLRSYINQAPHLLLFKLSTYDEQWLPYVVKKVVYHPRDGRDNPAYVNVDMAHFDGDNVRETTCRFDSTDLYHKGVAEMLRDAGYVLEDKDLMVAYYNTVAYYQSLVDKTGMRVNGHRYGTSASRYSWGRVFLETDGVPASLVIDDGDEDESGHIKNNHRTAPNLDSQFWGRSNYGDDADPKKMKKAKTGDDEVVEDDGDDEDGDLSEHFTQSVTVATAMLQVPLHPYIGCFDLRRHEYVNVHASNLTKYEFDEKIADRLVLPKESKELVSVLIENASGQFEDIVRGKAGGAIILCAGSPGTGKTLTAEVYAEVMKRPLYTVQCSQLGTNPSELEKELRKTMVRAMRWKAVLLIDEADVYIHERGADVNQNAIVGVFLRVLEYYNGVLFMTTNRPDDIDDAIASRATAKLVYKTPSKEDQRRLWSVLSVGLKTPLADDVIDRMVGPEEPDLSGRDIKNLLKLSAMLAAGRKKEHIDFELVTYVRQFK
jgi:hypothetical protein